MLQNTRTAVFIVSDKFRENQQGRVGGGGGKTARTPPPILIYNTWLIYHI